MIVFRCIRLFWWDMFENNQRYKRVGWHLKKNKRIESHESIEFFSD
jgi:hypothetical protein